MPDLEHTLQGHDLGFLKIVAGGWGLELKSPDTITALPVLMAGILEHADFAEIVEALPRDAKDVLQALLQNEGHMLWAAFVRKFGDVRRMGMAKRDRERPDLKPATAAEVLWYRALIGRAFLNLAPASEPQEYAYIPEDLLPLLPSLRGDTPPPLGRPASPNETAHGLPAHDRIIDHACTLLAALRLKLAPAQLEALDLGELPLPALKGLLHAAHLLDDDDLPHPENTRAFLEAPRARALAQLAQAWMESPHFNELRMLPGLKFEGEWSNNPLRARRAILELIGQIPENRWWSLPAVVAAIHEQQPDFQRPAGDYDSWFIRLANSETYLRGFGAWDQVDGALVRFLICGPMHWLGLLDLASSEPSPAPSAPNTNPVPAAISALRLSRWAEALWHGDSPAGLPSEEGLIKVSGDGHLTLPTLTPRAVRYQVARFCQWEGEKERDGRLEYHYRISPPALERAKAQGLRPAQLIGLLRRHGDGTLPPVLIQALERWEISGTQASAERVSLLRVSTPEILAALRKSRAGKYLGEALTETAVLIRPGMEEHIINALVEIGYLAESKIN